MRSLLIILLGFCCGIQGLKCRSQEGTNEAELKRIVRSCMQRGGSNNNQQQQQQDENDRRYNNQRYNFEDYGTGSGPGQRQQQQQQRESYDRWQRSLKQSDNNNNNKNNNNYHNNNSNNNNTGEMSGCVAQCFFEEMNMVDASGQPERRKVGYMLTKDLRDRELRNFYMDIVQQCFRYLEQGRYNNNKCTQSRELIKCMSEYAKAQCDDWEEYSNVIFN